MRMTSKSSTNPTALHAYPGTLERGALVSMHVRDPNVERPLGPYRDGVVNGAPASVIIGGYIAREWAVFPARDTASIKFATRGDAGALVTSARDSDGDVGGRDEAALALGSQLGRGDLVLRKAWARLRHARGR